MAARTVGATAVAPFQVTWFIAKFLRDVIAFRRVDFSAKFFGVLVEGIQRRRALRCKTLPMTRGTTFVVQVSIFATRMTADTVGATAMTPFQVTWFFARCR